MLNLKNVRPIYYFLSDQSNDFQIFCNFSNSVIIRAEWAGHPSCLYYIDCRTFSERSFNNSGNISVKICAYLLLFNVPSIKWGQIILLLRIPAQTFFLWTKVSACPFLSASVDFLLTNSACCEDLLMFTVHYL